MVWLGETVPWMLENKVGTEVQRRRANTAMWEEREEATHPERGSAGGLLGQPPPPS